jgi:hypothetical protein
MISTEKSTTMALRRVNAPINPTQKSTAAKMR